MSETELVLLRADSVEEGRLKPVLVVPLPSRVVPGDTCARFDKRVRRLTVRLRLDEDGARMA